MPMELDIQKLTYDQKRVCQDTISPNTFYMLVGNALVSQDPLSLVRMGDGEKFLWQHAHKGPPDQTIKPPNSPFSEAWLKGLGCYDIPNSEMLRRLHIAAEECSHFAPNIMGIQRDDFGVAQMFGPRDRYVDNWCVRSWSRKHQDQLISSSDGVLIIHADRVIREKLVARVNALGRFCSSLEMATWQQADEVIEAAKRDYDQLVLFAGGPAGKHIAPAIAGGGCRAKVVLDLGHAAAEEWL